MEPLPDASQYAEQRGGTTPKPPRMPPGDDPRAGDPIQPLYGRELRPAPTTYSTVTAVTLCLCVTFLLALLIIRLT